jgi:hypothetical protein
MRQLPPYSTVAVPIWLVLFLVLVIVLPLNAWWEPLAPTQYAAFVLREASYLPLARAGDNGCQYGEVRAWQRLQQHPQGREWFRRVLEARPAPAGRVLALAGLAQAGAAEVTSRQLRAGTDSVHVLTDSGWIWWAPPEVTQQLTTGRLAERLADAGPCPQWGLH